MHKTKPSPSVAPEQRREERVPDLWTWLIVATLPAAVAELFFLHRARREWGTRGGNPAPPATGAERARGRTHASGRAVETTHVAGRTDPGGAESPPLCTAEAVLCFDPSGRCTSANPSGRQLLPRPEGECTLSELLPGGATAANGFLAAVAAEGVLERDEALASVSAPALVHVRALALRDRDDNFWGAVLFVRPTGDTCTNPGNLQSG